MGGEFTLHKFLDDILNSIRARDGNKITNLIQLDLQSLPVEEQLKYKERNEELNRVFPANNDGALAQLCRNTFPQNELGSFHSSFSESIIQYLRYLRDFQSTTEQTKAYEIRQLTSQCITALGDSKYGVIMIPIVLSFSRYLAKIATYLDRNPEILQQANKLAAANSDEPGGSKVSFVESTANVLRDAFIKCLAGSPGAVRTSRPAQDDKRYGIYLTANSCLKLLWQCRKLRNAQQMFLSIDAQSPPLSFYPAAQRVTYLYYLGRYHFANNHFLRAQLALESAYEQCHRLAIKHRRLILIYLVAANICLGRLPSAQLFQRPESADLAQYFVPLCRSIRSGNLKAFHTILDLSSESVHAQWFLKKRILLQLRDRCEVLIWRTLIRKVFIIAGYKGEEKKIPFMRLSLVQTAMNWALHSYNVSATFGIKPRAVLPGDRYVDSDFQDADAAMSEMGFDADTGSYHDELINETTTSRGIQEGSSEDVSLSIREIESIFLSLIQQGFLRGFVLHNPGNPRFAIPGSQAAGGPVRKGFPGIWEVVQGKSSISETVPGWVKDNVPGTGSLRSGASPLGGVIRLSGARPVGVGS